MLSVLQFPHFMSFPCGTVVKNPSASAGDAKTWVWSPGQEDSLEKEIATCSNILAWKVPWTEEPGRLQSMGSQRVRPNWAHISYIAPTQRSQIKLRMVGWTREMNASQLSSVLLFPVVYGLLFTTVLILKYILPTPQFLISGYLINYYWSEMGKFLETYNLPRVIHEEIENLNKSIMGKEIASLIKNCPKKKGQD